MVSNKTKIINTSGLHARPASVFAEKAKGFQSTIVIRNLDDPDSEPINAKSILRILSLGIAQGTNLEISADGPDEQLAIHTLSALIGSGFGEV